MQIRFRTKILLALTLSVGAVLAAVLWRIDRAFARELADLTAERVDQGTRNFKAQIDRVSERLLDDASILAPLSRIQEPARDRNAAEVRGIVRNEIEARLMAPDFVVVADKEGKPLARLLSHGGKLEDAAGEAEQAIVSKAIESPDPVDGFIVVERRLMRVVAIQSLEGDNLRFILVLGAEITDAFANRIHDLQATDDHAGFVVDGEMVAGSLPDAARRALHSRGGLTAQGRFDATLEGQPYRVDLEPVPRSDASHPLFTVVFISLQKLLGARAKLTRETLSAGAIGLGVAVILGLTISRGVTAPVRDLVVGTERVARGDYSYRIVVRSRDELGDLAGSFNKMATDLSAKEKMRAVLNKVVAPEVAQELLRGDLTLGGDLVRATLLFADLRGFTPLTQGMPPQAIVAMLNEFMTAMHEEILACHGIVDKYVGDEVIALFGVPRALGHDAFAAVEAAQRMRERLLDLNALRAGRGERPLAMGIGVHTGEVVAGRMGSEQQLNYTCIGEAVNLASRLCSNAKAGQILVSRATLDEAGDSVEALALDAVTVKGFSTPVPVFDVLRVEIGETSRRRGMLA